MKTSQRFASTLLFAFVFTFLSILSFGQSIIRQSIGTIGGSATVGTVVFQSAVGQCFESSTNHSSSLTYRPGFIQPITVKTAKSSVPLSLNVYPNPATTSLSVRSTETMRGVKLQVLDLHGRSIYTESHAEADKITIDCSQWSNGTYIIRVQDASNKVHTSKIIINN